MVAPPRSPSIALRAFVALGLLSTFYLLALAVSAALAWIAWRLWHRAGWSGQAAAAVYLCAALLVAGAALVVRRRTFEPPGPEVREAEQPALVALVRATAAALGTGMPRRIFLTADVNAFVAEVGGFLGLGTTRVIAIGLGLLSVDSVSELRATIAHELGHAVAGDTRLGPILHRARTALDRVASIGDGLLSRPLALYRRLFLRVTLDVSRRQELEADRAAVAAAGARAHVSALRREARGGALFEAFLRAEVAPLLARGHRPENLYEGFRAYASELEAQGATAELDRALESRPTDPHDTHPSLAERVAFALALSDPGADPDDRPARSLLANAEQVERDVGDRLASDNAGGAALVPVPWQEVGSRVWAPALEEEGRLLAERIALEHGGARTATAALCALVTSLAGANDERAALLLDPALARVTPAERTGPARRIVERALGVLIGQSLVERGGEWRSAVGRPLQVALSGGLHCPWALAREGLDDRASLARLPPRLDGLPGGA